MEYIDETQGGSMFNGGDPRNLLPFRPSRKSSPQPPPSPYRDSLVQQELALGYINHLDSDRTQENFYSQTRRIKKKHFSLLFFFQSLNACCFYPPTTMISTTDNTTPSSSSSGSNVSPREEPRTPVMKVPSRSWPVSPEVASYFVGE